MREAVVVLHPAGQAPLGVGLADAKRWTEEGEVAYVLPSQRLVRKMVQSFGRHDWRWQKRIDVRTFDRWVRQGLPREEKRPLLTAMQQNLLVLLAVERVQQKRPFHYFQHSLRHAGWVSALEDWIGEMKRAGCTVDVLRRLWAEGTAKQKELWEVFAAYQALLAETGFADHEEEYAAFIRWLKKQPEIYPSLPQTIILEHFFDLNPLQAEVLQVLRERGCRLIVHLEYDETRPYLFHETAQTIALLRRIGFVTKAGQKERFFRQDSSLQALAGKLFTFSGGGTELLDRCPVELLRAPTLSGEVEMVAARIKQLVREEGCRLSDIALVINDMEAYQEELLPLMERAGIPLSWGEKQTLVTHPLIQGFLHLLLSREENTADRSSLWLNPYFPWGTRAAECLEGYRLLGKPATEEEWQARMEERLALWQQQGKEEEAQRWRTLAPLARSFYRLCEKIPPRATATQYASILRNVEEEAGILSSWQRLLTTEKESHYRVVARDLKALQAWHEVLDELIQLAALARREEEELPLNEYIRRLQLACAEKEYVVRPGVRGGVQVLTPGQIRGQRWRAVFLLGMVEGMFPREMKNDWLLPDAERRMLTERGLILHTAQEQYQRQSFHFFTALAAAQEKLFLSYPAADAEGKVLLPSSFVEELCRHVQAEGILQSERDVAHIVPLQYKDCVTEARLTEKLVYDHCYAPDVSLPSHLYPWLRRRLQPLYGRIRAEWERRGNHPGPFAGRLHAPVVRNRVAEEIRQRVWSASQLELLMQCRFAFFAEKILRLTAWEEEEEGMSSLEQGELLHHILFRFLLAKRGVAWEAEQKEAWWQDLLRCAEEELAPLRTVAVEQGRNAVRWAVEEERLLRLLHQFLEREWQRRESDRLGLEPTLLELSFGMPRQWDKMDERSQEEILTLTLSGKTIRLRGKIDRVDMAPGGEYVVYDYKKGSPLLFRRSGQGSPSNCLCIFGCCSKGWISPPIRPWGLPILREKGAI